MRAFDWPGFFTEHRIEFVDRGKNVARGEINIRCPFCGSADPSHHMGLSLETGWWSCWRNRSQHSGKSPLRLIMKLLGVSYGQAREIAGLGDDYVDPEGFDAMAARLMGRIKIPDKDDDQDRSALDSFGRAYPLITEAIRTRRHWNYLYNRGFNETRGGIEDVDRLVRQYDLRAGISGVWSERVLIPYFHDRELVTWTGRAIGAATIRYRDLEVKASRMAPKQTLYNFDAIRKGGRALILQEGPFDVLKIDFYGAPHGVRSVGLSTNSISEDQAHLLREAEGRFSKIIVMMDTKGELDVINSMRMRQDLAFIPGLTITPVPYGAGDGGNLKPAQIRRWISESL